MASKGKDESGYFIYQGVKYHSLFNENGVMYFSGVNIVKGPMTFLENVRYGFSCSEQPLFVIERSFDALGKGKSNSKGDDEIRRLADIFFKDGMEDLRTRLWQYAGFRRLMHNYPTMLTFTKY